jgi:vacuolar-type H+-ATPase subunit H
MNEMMIEVGMQILGELVLAIIGVAGAWLMAKIAQREKLHNIAIATGEAVEAAVQTAAALQQTVVLAMKEAAADGKLTEQDIQELGILLLNTAMKKLSDPAKDILTAAGKDITAIIQDAAEEWILMIKGK